MTDFRVWDFGEAWCVAPRTAAAAARLGDVPERDRGGAELAQRIGPALVLDAREAPAWAAALNAEGFAVATPTPRGTCRRGP